MNKRVSVRGIIVKDDKLVTMFRRKTNRDRFGKVLSVKEYYVIPGGGVDPEEEYKNALKRELQEELNIKVNVKKLLFDVESDERIEHFYKCEYVSGNFEIVGEEVGRNTDDNYYEIRFIDVKEVSNYDISEEVKNYFSHLN